MKVNNNDQQWCYGITKGSTENDLLLVYCYDSNLSENLLGVTLKYKIDGLIDKLHNTLNKLMINRNDLSVKANKTIETTIKTLKRIEDCANCKDKEVGRNGFDEFRKLINKIGREYDLVENLFKTNIRLNKEVLCEGCKGIEIRIIKPANKCENKEIAKFLHQCNHIRWIPFNEFTNIKYLAKGGFGEVYKATWFIGYYNKYTTRYEDEVVLKRIYNSNDKIIDILSEVKTHH